MKKKRRNEEVPDGIFYHNPGNLRITNDEWVGLDRLGTEMRRRAAAKAEPQHSGFFAFLSAPHGIRAIAETLKTYQEKRKAADGTPVDTIGELVRRYAPASDNNPVEEYVDFLCVATNRCEGDILNFRDYDTMRALVPAIIHFEQGVQPYPDTVIDKGLFLAGIEPTNKPLRKSRTIKGASVAALGAVGSAGTGMLQTATDTAAPVLEAVTAASAQVQPILSVLRAVGWIPKWVMPLIILMAAGVIVYARVDDRKKGVR